MIFVLINLYLSAYVFLDAAENKIGKIPSKVGFFNLSAEAWATGTIFLSIIFLPTYLIKRSSLIQEAREIPIESKSKILKLSLILGYPSILGFMFILKHGKY